MPSGHGIDGGGLGSNGALAGGVLGAGFGGVAMIGPVTSARLRSVSTAEEIKRLSWLPAGNYVDWRAWFWDGYLDALKGQKAFQPFTDRRIRRVHMIYQGMGAKR